MQDPLDLTQHTVSCAGDALGDPAASPRERTLAGALELIVRMARENGGSVRVAVPPERDLKHYIDGLVARYVPAPSMADILSATNRLAEPSALARALSEPNALAGPRPRGAHDVYR